MTDCRLFSLGSFKDPVDQKEEKVFFLEGSITELSNYYFMSERLAFWSTLKINDVITLTSTWSNKFKYCALVSYIETEGNVINVGNRRILIHGSNENGVTTCANSDNCLIPLRSTRRILELIDTFKEKEVLTQGISKAECSNYFSREPILRKIKIKEILHV